MNWKEHPLVRKIDTTTTKGVQLISASAGSSFDHNALVPGLPVLLGELRLDKGPPNLLRNLPGHLNKGLRSFEQLHRLQLETVQEHADKVKEPNALHILEPITQERFAIAMESFLGYAVQVQNHWVGILALALPSSNNSLPSSLNDVMKGIASGKAPMSALPEGIRNSLNEYWETHGRLVRLYRDFAQHFGEVVSDVILFKQEDGEFGLICQLVNNPEQKSASKAFWGKPPIHCLLYALAELEALISFTGYLIKQLLPPGNKEFKMHLELFKSTFPELAGADIVHYGLAPANTVWIQEVVELAVKKYSPFEKET